jgi:phosphoribosylformylglycinamidine cyclo-ligase
VPPIMQLIASAGVDAMEMRRTFNMGLGMVIAVPAEAVPAALAATAADGGRVVGRLVPRGAGPESRYVGEA